MDGRAVLFVLSYLLLILGVCMLAPLGVSIIYDSHSPFEIMEIVAFALVSLFCMITGLIFRRVFQGAEDRVGRREGFAIVTFSWLLAVVVGMLPYLITGVCDNVTDAFFETMSGFTTTGATIFPKVEIIPHGLMFWRCMTQWLGGMGIVVLSVALLPILGVGGYRLLKAEAPGGVAFEREKPRITDMAKDLWKLYLIISGAELILLRLSGMSIYDAFCHTFTTMSTGGFSPHSESIAYFTSPWTQWIIIVFMFLAGTNFSIHAQIFRGRILPAVRNPEYRLYAGIIFACIAIGLVAVPFSNGIEQHIRGVAFQIVSIGTTTGYATKDFDLWPQLMRLLMVLLMLIGSCMGSTGGGIKVARLLIYAKSLARELQRLIFPRAVAPLRVGDKVIEQNIVSNILAFGIFFVAAFVFGALVMAAFGYDIPTSISASAAALGNIGPGLGKIGPTLNWSHLPIFAKWVMSSLMLFGRLELFSVLILFTSWAWKR